MSERADNIINLFQDSKNETEPTFNQSVTGNNNTVIGVGRDLNIRTEKVPDIKISVMPPHNSIGSDSLLKKRIVDLFNKVADARVDRLNETQANVRKVMYRKSKKDFKMSGTYTEIWTWPKTAAQDIINYWEYKWNQTIPGRMEKAAKKDCYIPPRPYLYKLEKDYLDHLGLKRSDKQVLDKLESNFGVTTRKDLTHEQQYLWVKYLECQVENLNQSDFTGF